MARLSRLVTSAQVAATTLDHHAFHSPESASWRIEGSAIVQRYCPASGPACQPRTTGLSLQRCQELPGDPQACSGSAEPPPPPPPQARTSAMRKNPENALFDLMLQDGSTTALVKAADKAAMARSAWARAAASKVASSSAARSNCSAA